MDILIERERDIHELTVRAHLTETLCYYERTKIEDPCLRRTLAGLLNMSNKTESQKLHFSFKFGIM
jgi:hypothetical protein